MLTRCQKKHVPWTEEEDRKLKELMHTIKKGKWNEIAEQHGCNRTGTQCRLRWGNYLCPGIVVRPWSAAEDAELVALHKTKGSNWHEMAAILHRSRAVVRSHYHNTVRRVERRLARANRLPTNDGVLFEYVLKNILNQHDGGDDDDDDDEIGSIPITKDEMEEGLIISDGFWNDDFLECDDDDDK